MPLKLSPTLVSAWLSCPHYLNLRLQGVERPRRAEVASGDAGGSEGSASLGPSMADILRERGNIHERNAVARLKADGLEVFECEVTGRNLEEKASIYAAEGVLDNEVVYQMPFVLEGMRGIADFIIHDGDEHLPVDTKLVRKEAKPGHVLQLCFYADAITQLTGKRPTHIEIWLGGIDSNGTPKKERHRLQDFDAYWHRMRGEISRAIENLVETKPEPCDHCSFCEYSPRCEAEWRTQDSVHFVAGVSKQDRKKLSQVGIETRQALAQSSGPIPDMDPDRSIIIQRQAQLQVEACPDPIEAARFTAHPAMSVQLLEHDPEDPTLQGLSLLPRPDEGDLFLDYEGHPFWTVDEGLIFLFGLHYRAGANWTYEAWWAHSKQDEREQSHALVEWIAERRRQFPGMHVYHYNHTERSTLATLLNESDSSDQISELFDRLQADGCFVDLLKIVRQSLLVGVESYGLKNIEKVAGYERPDADGVGRGADAVASYEQWMVQGGGESNRSLLGAISDYNEQDVVATRHVREWLLSLRERAGISAWPAVDEAGEVDEVDPLETALLAHPVGTPEHLLGDVLGYWRREQIKQNVDNRIALEAAGIDINASEDTIGRAQAIELVAPTGKQKKPRLLISWPDQVVSTEFDPSGGSKPGVSLLLGDGRIRSSSIEELNGNTAVIALPKKDDEDDDNAIPHVVALKPYTFFSPQKKKDQLIALASKWADPEGLRSPLSQAILNRYTPPAPVGGFGSDPVALADYVSETSGCVLPIQGPPGAGKTYTGSQMIKRLMEKSTNIRVGVVATSNSAVNNLLEAVLDVVPSSEWSRIGRFGAADEVPTDLKDVKSPKHEDRQVVFGTAFGLCNLGSKGAHFDVVFVDEAGQFALVDALAVSHAASSMVLLGDPLQLPQVSQASHPGGSEASILEHMLNGEATISPQRGVFLDTSWRMHPEICDFISAWRYEGRLKSRAACAGLSTTVDDLHPQGVGLRVKLMNHSDNQVRSDEELAEVVSIVNGALGKSWTNEDGQTSVIGVSDILVVAPFNAQRRAIRSALERNESTRGIEVGTVDKFQGREAPIVIFSMASSSADDVPRGADFLFDSNRLNVAISRAKCLAYVICNEPLLRSRARSVDQMKLISGLCSFVARAIQV